MYGTKKQNFSNQEAKIEHLLKFLINKELIFFRIITLKEMHGIIDFMRHMIHKVLLNFLEVRNHLLKS